jgi:hypothetical protein
MMSQHNTEGISNLFKTGASTGPPLSEQLRDALAINASGVMEAELMLWGASVAVDIAIGDDGFFCEFAAVVGAGAGAGAGFALDVAISAPFGGVEQLGFEVKATLQADFGDAIGAAAAEAMLAISEPLMEAADDARDVIDNALTMLHDSEAAEIVQAALRKAFDAVVAKGRVVLTKCTDTVCKATLSVVLAAYDAAVQLAETAFDAAIELFNAATDAFESGWAAAEEAVAALPDQDKVWADVVELVSSVVDAAVPKVERAVFSASLGGDAEDTDDTGLVFMVGLNVSFFGEAVTVSTELEVDLDNVASAATALAATVEEAVRGIGGGRHARERHTRTSASNGGVTDWLAAKWPTDIAREPLSKISLANRGPSGTVHVFRQRFALEDAIEFHAFAPPREALPCV